MFLTSDIIWGRILSNCNNIMAQQIDPNQQNSFDPNQGFNPPTPNNGFTPPPNQQNPYDPSPLPAFDPNETYTDPNAGNYQGYQDPNAYQNPNPYAEQPAFDPNTQYQPVNPASYQPVDPSQAYYDPSQYSPQANQGFDPNAGYTNPNQGYTDPNQISGYPPTPQYNDPYAPAPIADPQGYPPTDSYAGFQATDPYSSGFNDANQVQNNTDSFEVKKNGSRTFLIIGVSIIIILLIATFAILFMLNNQGDTPASDTATTSSQDLNSESSESSEQSSSISSATSTDNTGLTANEGTPAGEAKVNAGRQITPDWLIQYFSTNGAVDQNGNCLQVTTCGESADPDKDGLKNSEEFEYDTDPLNPDTDSDGISDGNEVFVYFTHPRIKDSDQDNTEDGAEIVACTDPINDTADKIGSQRREEIVKLLEIWQLTDPTTKTLTNAGATPEDINKGFIEENCTGITVEL